MIKIIQDPDEQKQTISEFTKSKYNARTKISALIDGTGNIHVLQERKDKWFWFDFCGGNEFHDSGHNLKDALNWGVKHYTVYVFENQKEFIKWCYDVVLTQGR